MFSRPVIAATGLLVLASPARADECPDGMAPVVVGEETVCVDRWEASRPDATASSAGKASEGPPLSRAGVLPWTLVTRPEAAVACATANKRLCTFAELGLACAGPDGWRWPWGEAYDGAACNGYASGLDKVAPTGSFSTCESPAGLFDVSGNVQEWTDSSSPAGNACVFGGDYFVGNLSAQQNEDSESCAPASFACIAFEDPAVASYTNLGFRCCAAPGTVVVGADAGGADAGVDAGAGGDVAGAEDAGADSGSPPDAAADAGSDTATADAGTDAAAAPDALPATDTPPIGPLPDLVIGGPSGEDAGTSGGGPASPPPSATLPVDEGCAAPPGPPAAALWLLLSLLWRPGRGRGARRSRSRA